MRLVRNPSYKHLKEIVTIFNQYKDVIFYKDYSQYSESAMETLLFCLYESKKINMKKDHILWLTEQLWKDSVSSKEVAKEDYLQLVKFHFMNQKLLKPINSYENVSELNRAINSLGEIEDVVSEKDYDIFYESQGWLIAMPHTTQASCNLGKDTDWCTARTKSQNLFLTYVGRYESDIILFYVIKIKGNPIKNPNDKLSVGFVENQAVFDSEYGGLTVNSVNIGLSLEEFENILGKDLADIFLEKMQEKADSIKGKHPAKREMERIAKSTDKYLKKISEFKNEKDLKEFNMQIARYPATKEIFEILIESNSSDIFEEIARNESLAEDTQIALIRKGKPWLRSMIARRDDLTEKAQVEIVRLSDEIAELFVISSLISNQNLSEKAQLEILEKITLVSILNSLSTNMKLTKKVQELIIQRALSNNNSVTLGAIAARSSFEEIQIKLLNTGIPTLLNLLAGNKNITEKVQLALAIHPYSIFRVSLAKNTSITEKVQLELLGTLSAHRFLAKNTGITEKVQLELLLLNDYSIMARLLMNRSVKGEIREMIKQNKAYKIGLAKDQADVEEALSILEKEAK